MNIAKKIKDYIYTSLLVIIFLLPMLVSFVFVEYNVNVWSGVLLEILKSFFK
jgi:hypothetical protein